MFQFFFYFCKHDLTNERRQSLPFERMSDRMPVYLFLSVHDFRSRRKTCVHFMTEELAKRGKVRFWSVGMSALSEYRGDTRADLRDKANKTEIVNNVECHLQRGLWHPFRLKPKLLRPLEQAMFSLNRWMMPSLLKKWIREADEVFIESGMAAVYIADVRRLNPRARIVYWAADDLTTIGAAETIRREFLNNFDKIDIVRLTSPKLLAGMPHARSSIFAPHGMNKALMDLPRSSPFGTKKAGVSVGSMLFDPDFFNQVASAFPDIEFHVIGAGKAAEGLSPQPNVIVHEEMPYEETLAYLQHATFGIAPYRDGDTPDYLIDTSLKLKQFAYFGKPAVCPEFALGDVPGRCGYISGRKDTMIRAVQKALDWSGPIEVDVPEWSEVAERILEPERFPQYRFSSEKNTRQSESSGSSLLALKQKIRFPVTMGLYGALSVPASLTRCRSASQNIKTLSSKQKNASGTIPKKIWMYWHDEKYPDYIGRMIERVKDLNPDHELHLLNYKTVKNYIADNITGLSNLSVAMKSDLIRLELLAAHGGIWMDCTSIVTESFEWLHSINATGLYNFTGYFRDMCTTDYNFPIMESWFIAAGQNDQFIINWRNEFRKILVDGPKPYFETLKNSKDYKDICQKIVDPFYFLIYLSCQVAMRRTENFSFYARSADETGLFYQDINSWKSWKVALCLAAQKQPVRSPEIIKLTRMERFLLDPIMKHRLWHKQSIIGELLK